MKTERIKKSSLNYSRIEEQSTRSFPFSSPILSIYESNSNQINNFHYQLIDLEKRYQFLQLTIDKIRNENKLKEEAFIKSHSIIEKEIQNQKDLTEEKIIELNHLKSEKNLINNLFDVKVLELEKYKSEVDSLVEINTHLKAENKSLTQENDKANKLQANLQTEIDSIICKYNFLIDSRKQEIEMHTKNEYEIVQLNATILNLLNDNKKLFNDNQQILSDYEQERNARINNQKEIERLLLLINKFTEEKTEFEIRSKKFESLIQQNEGKNNELNSILINKDKELDEKKEEISKINSSYSYLKSTFDTINIERSELKNTIKKLNQEIEKLGNMKDELILGKENNSKEINKLINTINDLKEEISKSHINNNEKEGKIQTMAQENLKMNQELTSLKEKLEIVQDYNQKVILISFIMN